MSLRNIPGVLSHTINRIITLALLSTLISASGIFAAEEPVVHNVVVGIGDNQYHPNVTYANVGDIVCIALFHQKIVC
jgi:hypothetical protein